MTYEERIEHIARAICGEEAWAHLNRLQRLAELGRAKAADRACLAAIKEPTKAMMDAHPDYGNQLLAWHSMHAAIPRGEP